ncbi:hypothetical protein JR316_0009917 [Psilocybe cubensis]|uniref:Uncharacterized protein n=2 Tax=Psilocybe cubensis TaxID=181762 RepID=A0A8H8CGC3_PSICU|nr:hypothetical protein JR316_0009917 [Psilocybe cubensis]KAH9477691.1 hypothetical protein JR316_0009917 [Psilocybe cubensis]
MSQPHLQGGTSASGASCPSCHPTPSPSSKSSPNTVPHPTANNNNPKSPLANDETDKMLEEITNTNTNSNAISEQYDRFKTPSPKTIGGIHAMPPNPNPQHPQRPRDSARRRNRARFSYSSDIELSSDEALHIHELSRENGKLLFEYFNQTYVAHDEKKGRISPGRARAFKRARRVLDSPFLESSASALSSSSSSSSSSSALAAAAVSSIVVQREGEDDTYQVDYMRVDLEGDMLEGPSASSSAAASATGLDGLDGLAQMPVDSADADADMDGGGGTFQLDSFANSNRN